MGVVWLHRINVAGRAGTLSECCWLSFLIGIIRRR